MKLKIGDKLIGEEEPCFIIAEAGVNHNGSVELAKKLIDAAKDAGADAVKFQTFKAESVVVKDAQKAEYQKETTGEGSQYEMIKKLELTEEDFRELADYSEKKDIMFSLKSVSHLSEIQALKRSDIYYSYIVTDTLFCILSYFLQSDKKDERKYLYSGA